MVELQLKERQSYESEGILSHDHQWVKVVQLSGNIDIVRDVIRARKGYWDIVDSWQVYDCKVGFVAKHCISRCRKGGFTPYLVSMRSTPTIRLNHSLLMWIIAHVLLYCWISPFLNLIIMLHCVYPIPLILFMFSWYLNCQWGSGLLSVSI